jgi:hypothetical protein
MAGTSLLQSILQALQSQAGSGTLMGGQGVPAVRPGMMQNGWPTMLNGPSTPALPAPSGLPAATGGASGLPATGGASGLPATGGSNLPAVIDGAGAGAADAGGAGIGGAIGGAAMRGLGPIGMLLAGTKSANSGEIPMYVIDPVTGKYVPNPAADAAGLFGQKGFGGGSTVSTPPQNYGVPTNMDGTPPASVPLPRPRPPMNILQNSPAASQPAAQAPAAPAQSGGLFSFLGGGLGPGAARTPDGPALIQKFMTMLGGAPSVSGGNGGGGNPNPNNSYGYY